MWNMIVLFVITEFEVCTFCSLVLFKSLLRVNGIGFYDANFSPCTKSGVSCEGKYPRARSLRKNFS